MSIFHIFIHKNTQNNFRHKADVMRVRKSGHTCRDWTHVCCGIKQKTDSSEFDIKVGLYCLVLAK